MSNENGFEIPDEEQAEEYLRKTYPLRKLLSHSTCGCKNHGSQPDLDPQNNEEHRLFLQMLEGHTGIRLEDFKKDDNARPTSFGEAMEFFGAMMLLEGIQIGARSQNYNLPVSRDQVPLPTEEEISRDLSRYQEVMAKQEEAKREFFEMLGLSEEEMKGKAIIIRDKEEFSMMMDKMRAAGISPSDMAVGVSDGSPVGMYL